LPLEFRQIVVVVVAVVESLQVSFNDLDSMWPAKATAAAEQLMADIGDIGTLSADCGR